MIRLRMVQTFDAVDVANAIGQDASEDDLYELVVALDEAGASWNLTERLHAHFAEQMTQLAAEKALDEAESTP